jgi:FkbM family methyltransferase
MSFLSYAPNFEDVLLHRVFGGQETGFYVDVGAYHPVIGSITKTFYDRGWSGINVEPGSIFSTLAAARPRDVNLLMAALDRAGEVAFVENEDDRGTSYVSQDAACAGTVRMVPCDTLEAIVRAHAGNRPVDFIKVDVEGAEGAIVRSTDWRQLRPRVLLLEATRPWSSVLTNQEWEPILLEQGYVRVFFDGINCFYVPEEEAPFLQRHFDTPVNVLDRVVRHEENRLHAALDERTQEVTRLAGERDALQAALGERTREMAALTVERDALHAALGERTREMAALTVERDALHAALGERTQEVARLAVERDTLHVALDERTQGVARLAGERDTLQREVARLAGVQEIGHEPHAEAAQQSPAPPLAALRGDWRRRLGRRAAKAAYMLVRPVARPIAWRLRGFLTGDLFEQVRQLGERIEALAVAQSIHLPTVVPIETCGAAEEMRRLAAEIERALLTLALERVTEGWSAVPSPPAESLTPTAPRVTLVLPRDRTVDVECTAGDLSVSAALVGSGGDWEPHVRRYLEAVVQPDWVCLDIGANLGAHALSLAVLAPAGRVVAFEADADNFRLLSRNAAALAAPHAVIEPVRLALWDRPGTLHWAGADELTGRTFVAEDPGAVAAVEQHLRAVVSRDAIDGVELHIRRGEVAALPLDTWIDNAALPRVDVIRLNVEGAEARVIRGADATLRHYRPMLLVEYNPACAAEYFGQPADALFHELATRFANIAALEPDGTLTPLAGWPALEARLAAGKGWEDLVCAPGTDAAESDEGASENMQATRLRHKPTPLPLHAQKETRR